MKKKSAAVEAWFDIGERTAKAWSNIGEPTAEARFEFSHRSMNLCFPLFCFRPMSCERRRGDGARVRGRIGYHGVLRTGSHWASSQGHRTERG
jgi:hypothetical protein